MNQLVEQSVNQAKKIDKFVIALIAVMPTFALAADAPDVSSIVTYIGYATAAVVAIGVAKMIPAAAMWLYSSLTGMIKRG